MNPRPTIARVPAAAVGLSSVYSAAVAYLTLLIAARTLSPQDNAVFLVYWALLFGVYGVVTGVSPEAARTSYGPVAGSRAASVVGIALVYGAIIGVSVAASAPLWASRVLPAHTGLALIPAISCVVYTGHLAVWGVVTGKRQWYAVVGLTTTEATARLVLVGLALILLDNLDGLAIAAALPAGAWLLALALPVFRRAAVQRSDASRPHLLRNYAVSSLASSASALMMVGFPVLISATSTSGELSTSAGLMLGITLTRAPLLVPLTALQGVALAHFLRSPNGWRALATTAGPVLGITLVGAGLAYAVGPWLYGVLLDGSYNLSGSTLAALTLSAGLLATLTLTGMFALALHRHGLFAIGWVIATVAAVGLLLVPATVTERVLLSLLVGPLLGVLLHVVGLGRSFRAGGGGPIASSAAAAG